MTRKPSEGRHRVADGAVADTPVGPPDPTVDGHLRADAGGRLTVQLLNDQWFIGEAGAAQRIEDATWLHSWLAANGSSGPGELDFAGDHRLRERFFADFPADPQDPTNGRRQHP
jgi:hypothetical protein